MRRLLLLGLAVLAAGCGSSGQHATAPAKPKPQVRHVAASARQDAGKPPRRGVKGQPRPAGKERQVVVVVVNGDTSRRVWGAEVQIGSRTAKTNRRGAAAIRLRLHIRRPATVTAPGFTPKTVIEPFHRKPIVRIR
ncbi:MAG: hypothetical protein QOE36_2340, partial [Gaiellaceae bacterium]|nr:hypothetical protein [Gaiellaceae bacterium]